MGLRIHTHIHIQVPNGMSGEHILHLSYILFFVYAYRQSHWELERMIDSNGCLTTNDYGEEKRTRCVQLTRDQIIKENRELTGSYSIRIKQFEYSYFNLRLYITYICISDERALRSYFRSCILKEKRKLYWRGWCMLKEEKFDYRQKLLLTRLACLYGLLLMLLSHTTTN